MKDQRYFNCILCSKHGTPDNPLDGEGRCGECRGEEYHQHCVENGIIDINELSKDPTE